MSDPIEQNGVVGAGGAGFPTAVKLQRQAETYIVNAAECEPLLHKDKELLLHHGAEMLAGLRTAMERVNARRGVIGIKEKYEDVMQRPAPAAHGRHGDPPPARRLPGGRRVCAGL